MKRIFTTIFAAAALLLSSAQASAQYFDHLSLGVGAGTDGISLDLAVPVGNYVQLRAGGSYMPPIGITRQFSNFEYRPGETVDLSVMGQMQISAFNAMIDLFPGKETAFHFTLGLFAGDKTIANVHNTKPYLDEESWGTDGIMVGNTLVTTDNKGVTKVNLDINKFLPYLGIGFGRPVPKKAVSFVFDLGAIYTGGLGLYTNGTNVKTGQTEYVRITSDVLAEAEVEDGGIVDIIGSIPVLPMMKFSLFFKLF